MPFDLDQARSDIFTWEEEFPEAAARLERLVRRHYTFGYCMQLVQLLLPADATTLLDRPSPNEV